MTEAKDPITFKRNGAIMRGGIRVGWIEDHRDRGDGWAVRFTPASGMPGIHSYSALLSEAKEEARKRLA